jgi:hypothetical protein
MLERIEWNNVAGMDIGIMEILYILMMEYATN